jgi:Holliday junction resolvase
VAAATGAPFLSEDDVKRHLVAWLEHDGWTARVAWGKAQGIDVLATRGEEVWVIEAKGSGSLQPMRVNYFLNALGELLQHMDHSGHRYSIALPDLGQFRGMWQRLPTLAKQRLGLSALFVAPDGRVDEVTGL